jgi:beta-N-acetylhexosaminidase
MRDAASAVLVAAVEGMVLTSEEERFFREEAPAGVTLFKRNIPQDDYKKLSKLTADLQGTKPTGQPPLVIAIDQEGGRVARIGSPFPNLGPALQLAGGGIDSSSLETIKNYGAAVGAELKHLGVNVDFAPVVDIFTEPTNVAIGDRCFGVTAEQVSLRAGAFMEGLQTDKVLGCLKHFPGQGDARVDTHEGTAIIEASLQTLLTRELEPFRRLLPQSKMVMVSHSIFPALCDREASRSQIVIMDWLRTKLGFQGVVVSDDMNMGALPQEIAAWKTALVDAVAAGCDMLLVCRHLDRCKIALEALRQENAKSPAFRQRLEDAAARVTKLRHFLF